MVLLWITLKTGNYLGAGIRIVFVLLGRRTLDGKPGFSAWHELSLSLRSCRKESCCYLLSLRDEGKWVPTRTWSIGKPGSDTLCRTPRNLPLAVSCVCARCVFVFLQNCAQMLPVPAGSKVKIFSSKNTAGTWRAAFQVLYCGYCEYSQYFGVLFCGYSRTRSISRFLTVDTPCDWGISGLCAAGTASTGTIFRPLVLRKYTVYTANMYCECILRVYTASIFCEYSQ